MTVTTVEVRQIHNGQQLRDGVGQRFVYSKNLTQDLLINLATYVCEHFVDVDSAVCQGLSRQYRDELLYVVKEMVFNPPVFCEMFITECGAHVDFGNWSVTLPEVPKNQTYPKYPIKRPNMRVLQLTDIHIDSDYIVGSVANCKSFICCHTDSVTVTGTKPIPAGFWGAQSACDMPLRTVENMLQHIGRTEKFDYILVSGDFVAHTDWNCTKEHHLSVIRTLSELLDHYFPETPKFYALGNHDSVPVNSFAPHYVPNKYQPNWVYKQLWEMQNRWISSDQKDSVRYRGSYSTKIMRGLRLISLNTGYCETTNLWVYINQTDPDGTMTWLVEQLAAAEARGEYVHIMAHIPPGDGECLESWSRNYYRVVNRFSKTITAQFFGHIHVDSFSVFYENMNDDTSEPTNFLFSAPSVSTYAGLNPAYRIYEVVAGNQFEVFDYSTYFLNLSLADGKKDLQWEFLYSAKETYGLQEISAKSMNSLIDKIITDDRIKQQFIRRFKRFETIIYFVLIIDQKLQIIVCRNTVRRDDYECDNACVHDTICALKKAHHNDSLCLHTPNYALFSRRPHIANQVNELAYQILSRFSILRLN
uniref:Sphingomyelin phosphodiesterase n=1 Tax=Syphacia muris TaxID=451379 RepID=A0A0N5AMZ5_9BILA